MLRTRNWEVNREDVLESETPEPTETHKTISHGYIVETSEKIMEEENLTLKQSKYYMSANRMKYFGKYIFDKKIYDEPPKGIIKMSDSGLDIDHRSYDLNPNVTLGFVNSHDKSLASCVFFGTLMPICSNEGWHNRMWFKRKHTGNIESDLDILVRDKFPIYTHFDNNLVKNCIKLVLNKLLFFLRKNEFEKYISVKSKIQFYTYIL